MRAWPALEIRHGDAATGELIQARLLDFGVLAITSDQFDVSCAFFPDSGDRARAADAIAAEFPVVTLRAIDVDDLNWAERSQANLRAIRVGDIVVAPPWDLPDVVHTAREGETTLAPRVVVIQPSMGFGTGHHATTRLCLAALQRVDLRGLRVADVGTGSGVLAIAASMLGAESVTAIDTDADAVASARDNVALNPTARVDLIVGDIRSAVLGSFDVVIANLTGTLLVEASECLCTLAGPSGRVFLSGLMADEERGVVRAYQTLSVRDRRHEDEWVCLELAPDRQ